MTDYIASGVPKENNSKVNGNPAGAGGAIYIMAFMGATVYYLQTAATFWDGAYGIFKALVWPAILLYEVFSFLKI